jgi:hypothetical protein
MLVLLIPGKESISGNIDVYLAPLIEELQQLWHGVNAIDVSDDNENKKMSSKQFWCGAFTIILRMILSLGKWQRVTGAVLNVALMSILVDQPHWAKMYIWDIGDTWKEITRIDNSEEHLMAHKKIERLLAL